MVLSVRCIGTTGTSVFEGAYLFILQLGSIVQHPVKFRVTVDDLLHLWLVWIDEAQRLVS